MLREEVTAEAPRKAMNKATKCSGTFITFEGIDGVGKTTQAKLLSERISKLGLKITLTREPGGVALAEKVREIVLFDKNITLEAEFFLFMAARFEHVEKVIKPALHSGHVVLCDRFFDSTIVYQGSRDSIMESKINNLKEMFFFDINPEVTILLDIDVETAKERIKSRKEITKYDMMEDSVLCSQRQKFLDIAKQDPERFVVINVENLSVEDVSTEIYNSLAKKGLFDRL